MHLRTSRTRIHNVLQNLEVVPYQFSLRDRVCLFKIAASILVEVFTGVGSVVHAVQHCIRCDRMTKGLSGVFADLLRRFHQSTLNTTHKFSFREPRRTSRSVYIKYGCLLCYKQIPKFRTHGATNYLLQCKF